MCVRKVFSRNLNSLRKRFPSHEVVKQYSVCCLNTVGKHALSVERVVLVDYRMDGLNSTKPYDACVCGRTMSAM